MSMIRKDSDLPARSAYIAWEEFVEITGINPDRLEEIMDMGWLKFRRTGGEGRLFRSLDVYRVRKLERICCDFELPSIGGIIIVDLLERIAALERTLKERSF